MTTYWRCGYKNCGTILRSDTDKPLKKCPMCGMSIPKQFKRIGEQEAEGDGDHE